MTREEMLAKARAKYAREELLTRAKAKFATEQIPMATEDVSPDFLSTSDRLIAKNFAQSPEKQLAYLKQQYPKARFDMQDGEIVAEENGKWKRLDPSFSPLENPIGTLKDLPADIGDIAYDLGSGAVQGLATGASAIGGSLAGGVGAIPGAIAGSAASGAGLEALRQKIGQMAGIPQEVDGTDVAISGGAGAVSPMLFGAGKLTTGMMSNLARKAGMSNLALEAGEKAGRGVVERGYDWSKSSALPWMGEKISGISRDSIKNLSKNMGLIDDLERNDITPYAEKLMNKVQTTLGKSRAKAGQAVSDAMENAGKKVNITPSRDVWLGRADQLASKEAVNNADDIEREALMGIHEKYYTRNGSPLPSEISAKDAFELQRRMKPLAKFGKSPGNAKSLEEQQAMSLGSEAYGALNQSMDEATDGLSTQAKNEYSRIKGIDDTIGNSFDDADKTLKTAYGLDKNGKQILRERLKRLSDSGELDIQDELSNIKTYKDFVVNGMMSNAKQRIPAAGVGMLAGAYAGANSGTGQGGALIGGGLGGAAGGMLGAPGTIRGMIKGNKALESTVKKYLQIPGGAAQYVNPIGADALQNIWLQMQKKDEQLK